MVTEGPGSLVEFSRDTKEVSPNLLWFGVVLKEHHYGAQGEDLTTEGHGKMKEQGLHGFLAQ